MTDNLLARIDALSDSDLIEASSYYLAETMEVLSADEVDATLLGQCQELGADIADVDTIRHNLSHDRDSYSKLFRFLLREAARGNDEQRQLVEEAIEGAGQKQVVTELLLAISLGTLATMLLIEHTKGKVKEAKELDFEELPDGSIRLSIKEETIYADSSTALGGLLSFLKNLPSGRNPTS